MLNLVCVLVGWATTTMGNSELSRKNELSTALI